MSMTTVTLSGGTQVEVDDLDLLAGRILVQALPAELTELKTASGRLWLPQQAAAYQSLLQGEVLATGPGVSPLIPIGARVIVDRFSKTPLNEAGDLWVSWEDAVIAVIG